MGCEPRSWHIGQRIVKDYQAAKSTRFKNQKIHCKGIELRGQRNLRVKKTITDLTNKLLMQDGRGVRFDMLDSTPIKK